MQIDLRREARAAMSDLIDRLVLVAVTAGLLSTAVGLVRVTSQGWHLNIVTDLGFFLFIVMVLLLRNRLPFVAVVWLLVALAAASAVASFLTLGLGTMSFVILTTCCVVVGVAFGMRFAFALLAALVGLVGLIGAAITRGVITGQQVTDPFLLEPQTWLTQIAGFAAYTAVILVVVGALEARLLTSLRQSSRHADALRKNEERYRLLAENMTDVLYFQNMNNELDYLSPSVERVFGYAPDEAVGLTMADVMTPESYERARRQIEEFLAGDVTDLEVPTQEYRYVRKDGTTFWGEVAPTFVRDDAGRLIGNQGLMRDISDRKQIEAERAELERELHQADKLRSIGALAGGIAHDFNNQLAPIVAHADLLVRGMVAPDDVADHARRILAPARNAADLTSKLLTFARKGSYEHLPVDVHELIDEVADILAHGIDKRIKIKRRLEAPSAVVSGDRTQLQNVLLNLGLNARDAMPEGGEIVFRTSRTTEGVTAVAASPDLLVTVTDTGVGMEESVRRRAFEPFFTTKVQGQGTGMGLAAAYGTVIGHGGSIDIFSRLGDGTTVDVRLPTLTSESGPAVAVLPPRRVVGMGGRALVIDDEDAVREALCQLLESLGFKAAGFARGAEAVAHFGDHTGSYDVVVLDLILPDMNGRETLAALREIDPEVKILLVSGYAADEDVLSLIHSGGVDFLEKPFQLADLAESVTRLRG